MVHRLIVAVTCFTSAALFAAGPQLAQDRAGGRHAKLKLVPDDVMVNTAVKVKGTGFPRKTAMTLVECGRTFWLVPEEPCNTGNEVSVQTSSRGSFVTSMKAEVCPKGCRAKRSPNGRVTSAS